MDSSNAGRIFEWFSFTELILGRCPEDFHDIEDVICQPSVEDCVADEEDFGQWRHPYSIIPSTTLQPESTTMSSTENEFR